MTSELDSITDNDELEDGTEETPFTFAQIDVQLLTSPAVLRSVAGITLGLLVLAWPDRSDRVLARLVGIGIAWLAVVSLRSWGRWRPRDWLTLATSVLALAVGLALVSSPDRSTVFLGRVIGVGLVVYALQSAVKLVRSDRWERVRLAWFGFVAAGGLLLVAMTESVVGTAIALGAIGGILISLLTLVVSLDARTEGTASYSDTAALVAGWLHDRPKSVDARQSLYQKILYEGPTTYTRVIRFFALMGFAAVIASMGIITDSTAVVIGAMLVAPLMTPLMGMAISLVMGWPNRLTRSALIAFGGIVFAIAIGAVMGLVAPTSIDTSSNSQILARATPTILDLITAIAAGAAGAYGLSRPDVSDSLPGVAIAISLVPPLTVVGIAYSQTDWTAGNGALLLFATNMLAILLVGGLTFILTGVTPVQRAADNQHRVQTAVLVICTAAVLVFGALLINGAEITANALRISTVESTIAEWLDEAGTHRLVDAQIDGDTVSVVVIGPTDGLADVAVLAETLAAELGESVAVDLSLVVEERFTVTADP